MKTGCQTNPSGLRHGLTLIIAIMVISSPIVILVNPTLAVAAKSNMMDTSNNHATVSTLSSSDNSVTESSPSTTVGTPTIQAALSSLTARPTNNIVNTNSFYDVVFLAATSGTIKTIEVTFPASTTIPSGAFFNEAEGIGPGTVSKSGQTITYTVTNTVNVPAGTKIRLEFANINNPLQPSSAYQVTVTTRDAANTIIDGPSQSTAYTIKQIGQNAIAESFMKRVTLLDNAAGNALGWNPDGITISFGIVEPLVTGSSAGTGSFVSIYVVSGNNHFCDVISSNNGAFTVRCSTPPPENSELHYIVENLPPNTP